MVFSAKSTTKDYIRAKTNFNLSLIYSFTLHKSSNHKFPKNHTISPDTTLHITKHTQNIKNFFFEELVLSVLPLLKKHIRLEHAGIVDHFVDLSIPDFKKEF